ncbi:NADH-quinone oxidoreductase subunit A [Geobacteraceae bacterium]|nr:NADH-quinone oxidoreductase subunit A [Geobacteraceae bacterium]
MQPAAATTHSLFPTLPPEFLPLALYTVAATLLIGVLLLAAWWLGAKTTNHNKELPYESGVIPTGSARLAYPVPFYLIAIFFIVFDVEAAFIFAWATAWRELGMAGLVHITFFIVILLLGLVWLWIKGGLDWGPSRERRDHGRD